MNTVVRPTAAAPVAEGVRGLAGRMLLASGLLVVVQGAAFTVLLLAVADLRGTTRAAQDSEEVLATANEVERLVVDLETGVRGFVITREDRFLESLRAGAGASPPAWRRSNSWLPDTRSRCEPRGGSLNGRARTSRSMRRR